MLNCRPQPVVGTHTKAGRDFFVDRMIDSDYHFRQPMKLTTTKVILVRTAPAPDSARDPGMDPAVACRRLAAERGFTVLENHIYADQAKSGARRDRLGLSALLASGRNAQFDVLLVDDLSRIARDNSLMLPVLAEL